MIVKFRGILKEITPYNQLTDKRICDLIFFKPKDTNAFGQEFGRDNTYKVQWFENNGTEEFRERFLESKGQWCEVTAFLNGNTFEKDNKLHYANNLVLKNINPL